LRFRKQASLFGESNFLDNVVRVGPPILAEAGFPQGRLPPKLAAPRLVYKNRETSLKLGETKLATMDLPQRTSNYGRS